MTNEKSEYKDLGDRINDLTDNVADAFEKLGDAAADKLESSADKAGDVAEKLLDRLGNSWLMHKIDLYQARKGLLGGNRKFVKDFSNEVLTGWLKTRRSIAEGFRKQAQDIREERGQGEDIEQLIEHNEALAEGLENDVRIIGEELKERGVEL